MATNKQKLAKGLKYELGALPLLIIAPILITIGFKAIKQQNNYFWLIAGIIVGIGAVTLGFLGIKIILNAFFEKD
ncbi:DUF6095 family protein [Lutibacter holmesii]|uniref:DUF6095 family protein n=1 Tax=Lutibacter holmesii TaxID=1137985 RepID=A0ABW3WPZ9_9FLAO